MKKRIFISIALAVLLLEVGFGVYVAFERKYESALNALNLPIDSVKQIQIDTDRELELANVLLEEDFFADTKVTVAAKRLRARPVSLVSAERKFVATNVAANRPAKAAVRTEPDKRAVALKTTEIREVPAADLNFQKEPARTDNKSFIAKTQTILKKPFGWIKAIGSKLR